MITSFRVGAIFDITDHASPVVQRLAVAMQELAGFTATARAELSSLSAVRIGSLNTRLTTMVAQMDRGATAAAAMASATVAGAAQMDAGLSTALVTARALTAQMTAAGRASTALRVGGAGGGGSGVPIVPVPGGGQGGGRHGPHVRGPSGHVGPVHVSTGTGGTAIATGSAIWGVAHVMKEAKEPLHQEALLRLLGLDDAQIKQVTERARDTATAVPGSGYAENVKSIGAMYSVVGLAGSLKLSEKMAQLDRTMALTGKGKEEGSSYILTRAGELMGRLTDPNTHEVDLEGFGKILDTMSRVTVATHGKVTPAEWLNYAKQAGPASGALSEEGLYTTAAVIQAMGGNRAGTAAAAIQRQFAGGVMTKSKAEELTRLGIFKEGDYEVGRGGHLTFKTGAAHEFVERAQHDPLSMVDQVLIPALESKGITRQEDIIKELYKIIGTGPAQREIYELIRGREQIKQERERARKGLAPAEAIASATQHDPVQGMAAFTKSFNDMLGAIGSPTLTAAIPTMNALTSMFNSVAAGAATHKKTAAVAGGTLAGAAAGAGAGFLIGWAGGPIGAGGGFLLGGALGAATAFMGTREKGSFGAYPESDTLGAALGRGMAKGLAPGAAIGAGIGFWGGGGVGAFPGALLGGGVGALSFGAAEGVKYLMGGLGAANAAAAPGGSPFPSVTGPLGATIPAAIPGSMPAGAAAAPSSVVHIDVGGLTVKAETDDPRGLAEKILAQINRLITQGHTHNQGAADSTASSPFLTGAALP